MLRNGLAALAGVIGAVVLTMVLQSVAHFVAPPSSEMIEAFQKITSDDPDVIPEEVEGFFVEFRPFVALCHFSNCSHTHETGCAVKRAVESELIHASRYASYARIHAEYTQKAATKAATIEQAREIIAGELRKQPLHLVLVIVSHALGTFFGALTAVRVAREAHIVPASIVGSLMLLGGIANVLLIPHPPWFNAIDLLLYIPAALLAWRLAADPTSDSLTPGDEHRGPQSGDMTPVES